MTLEEPIWFISGEPSELITRIREVRRARGMTLDDVARRCEPATTAQTIGRLETGSRTVSVGWLNRIARALGVEAQNLVEGGGKTSELEVAAILGPNGVRAAQRAAVVVPPRVEDDQVAILVSGSVGEYRAGDQLWCKKLALESYSLALNRDVLVPRPGGRFLFGRLINRDDEKLQILPLEAGGRQQVVPNPGWLGLVVKLVRSMEIES